jgi:acetoin utilization deacetylase AcuC-like enzyme
MVEMLKSDAGIEAQTVSSFVNQHLRAALAGKAKLCGVASRPQGHHAGARRGVIGGEQADE